MNEFASHAAELPRRRGGAPELSARNLITGAHLWASATAFFFVEFVFAYFYLRSLNNGGMWRPKHVDPSLALGTLFTACIVASAVVLTARARATSVRSGGPEWRRKGLIGTRALARRTRATGRRVGDAGLRALARRLRKRLRRLDRRLFVFVSGTMYWLETVVATAIRYRNLPIGGLPPPGHASGDAHRTAHDIADPISLVRPQLTAVTFYAQFLAGVAVVSWVILYLV